MTFNQKSSKKDTKGHCILVKGKTYQEEFSILNIYDPNTSIKEVLLKIKAHIVPHTIIVDNFNTHPINGQTNYQGKTN